MTGLELQTRLAIEMDHESSFLTGHGDIPTTVKAMKGGATEFLLKPFDEDDLVRAIDAAIAFDRREREREREREKKKKVAFAISSHGTSARDSSLCVRCCTCSPARFPIAWFSWQADKPEREVSLVQRVSSADLGAGQTGGQRSADRLWHGSLGAAPTEYAANTI
jgi:DNA-binding NarL/FixJ family response regulator